jgi:hypothetical protein
MDTRLLEPDGTARASKLLTRACYKLGVKEKATFTIISTFIEQSALDDLYMSGSMFSLNDEALDAYMTDYFEKVNTIFHNSEAAADAERLQAQELS